MPDMAEIKISLPIVRARYYPSNVFAIFGNKTVHIVFQSCVGVGMAER
jgi:hypothetical protein